MIRINLLPYREKEKKENIKRQIIVFAGAFLIFVLTIILIQFSLTSSINSLENKIRDKEGQLTVLTKKLGDIERFKKDIRELEQKLAVIKGLEENRLFPVHMLDELAALVPIKDMWLVKLTETGADIRIEGVARNNIIVARFMKSLELSSIVSSVGLVSTKHREISGVSLLEFSILCTLKKG